MRSVWIRTHERPGLPFWRQAWPRGLRVGRYFATTTCVVFDEVLPARSLQLTLSE